jgi:hypothetical protein
MEGSKSMNDEMVCSQVGEADSRRLGVAMIAREIGAVKCRLNGLPVVVGLVGKFANTFVSPAPTDKGL